jgi:hypothetical protein
MALYEIRVSAMIESTKRGSECFNLLVLILIQLPPQRLFDPNQYLATDIRSN